jgi:hypothetical protein
MKRLLKSSGTAKPPVEEKITDALLGTGEHMCTCAAIVADIIVEQGQEGASLKELMEKIGKEGDSASSMAEKKP